MSSIRILALPEWDAMQQTKPLAKNGKEQQTIKQQLFTRVNKVYADRWNLLKQETRKAVETLLFSASDKGYTFIGREYLADKLKIGTATVSRIIATLRDNGVIQVVYRRAKGGNGMGNPVLLFTDHPYFDRWKSLLGLEKEIDDKADDKPRVATIVDGERVEDVKKSSTLDLSKNILKDFKTDIYTSHKEVINFKEYENDPMTFAAVANVPKDVVKLLSRGFGTSKIIQIWISMRRTLSKYAACYEDFSHTIQEAIASAINKYKQLSQKGKNLDFTRYLCGTIKKLLVREIEEHQRISYRRRTLPFYDWTETNDERARREAVEELHTDLTIRLIPVAKNFGLLDTAHDLPF